MFNNLYNTANADNYLMSAITTTSVVSLIWYILLVIAYWKIFTKAGRAGWKSLIPILNVYEQFDIVWSGWYGLLMLALHAVGYFLMRMTNTAGYVLGGIVVLIALIINIMGLHKLSRAFGHGAGYTVGLIFLQPIFMLILGFGSSRYVGKDGGNSSK